MYLCEISSSHGGEYEVQICLLGCTAVMMEAARASETSVDNYFALQYILEDKSELHHVSCIRSELFSLYGTTAHV
jgi:hypothetical protein